MKLQRLQPTIPIQTVCGINLSDKECLMEVHLNCTDGEIGQNESNLCV